MSELVGRFGGIIEERERVISDKYFLVSMGRVDLGRRDVVEYKSKYFLRSVVENGERVRRLWVRSDFESS